MGNHKVAINTVCLLDRAIATGNEADGDRHRNK